MKQEELSAKTYIVTGGAGFIGSALVRHLVEGTKNRVINLDALTYAGNLSSLDSVSGNSRYEFAHLNICDKEGVQSLFDRVQPDGVFHLAAESHVDRSIDGAADFIETNIVGTFNLLEVARTYWSSLKEEKRDSFRFLHVSTDEVYGSLGADGLFSEDTAYDPRSPYSSSKAASDFLVSAWFHTYGFPGVITNCSNNYGPFHFPEKLIPLVILRARSGLSLPIYGDGQNIRDWLYVEDHAKALHLVMMKGKLGEKYNVGGRNEWTNLDIVKSICAHLDSVEPKQSGSYSDQIEFVDDRPGHDRRYAIDATKIEQELGWEAAETFSTGIVKTIDWYRENEAWWGPLQKEVLERRGTKK